MKKLTKEEVQKRTPGFQIIEFVGYDNYLKVRCLICNKELEYKVAKNFIRNPRCSKCNGYNKSNEEWIEEAKSIHGDKYNYDRTNYISNKRNVEIYCFRCKEYFWQRPDVHLKSCGHICYKKDILAEKRKYDTKEFIKRIEIKFPNKYKYDKIQYLNSTTKVEIFCKKCEDYFWQQPDKLLLGFGCSKCSLERSIETRKIGVEEFINRSKEIHGDAYNYDKISFEKNTDKVSILCKKCNEYFSQSVASHLRGSGCPNCTKSKGEKIIKKILKEKGIDFVQNKEFNDLIDEGNLSYDFYLPKYNMLIEYNGIQHYEFVPYFHKTLKDFHKQLHHDWLKRKYTTKNGFNYLVIPYYEDIISVIDKNLII